MIRAPFNCKEIGEWLPYADDHQQADLLNAFGKELPIVCRAGGDSSLHGMHLCAMSKQLDRHGQELVTELAEFVKMRKEADES